MKAADPERRLLEDVLGSDAHRVWREDLRATCCAELGAPMERSLLADTLSDNSFKTFRDDLRARLMEPRHPRRRVSVGFLAAAAALVFVLVMAVPRSSPPKENARARTHDPAWIIASRPMRVVAQQPSSLVLIRTSTRILPEQPARSRMTYVASSPTRSSSRRVRLLAIVNTPDRPNLPNALSDEQLLAALPPCGLVKTGPNSQRLMFLDPRDERRLVNSR